MQESGKEGLDIRGEQDQDMARRNQQTTATMDDRHPNHRTTISRLLDSGPSKRKLRQAYQILAHEGELRVQ